MNTYNPNIGIPAILPINLLSLATFLKSKGFDCKIVDSYGLEKEEIIRIIRNEKPDIVGIGCQFTPSYQDVLDLARLIKQIDSTIIVVIGGNHASSLNRLDDGIDYIVKGEGEQNFTDLCKDLLDGKESPRIREHYPLVKDIDDFPMLDYSLINIGKYIHDSSPFHMRKPCMGIITSRGCPNDCIYCTVKGVWGRSWRGKSPKRTVDEMELLKSMGIQEFSILDDSISVDKKRFEGICDEIIDRDLDIKWSTPNGIAHWTLDKPLLKKMKRSGCYRITLGIESGNPYIRKFIRKDYPLAQAERIINEANRIGMWTIATTILGFPNETESMMMDTLNFVKRSGVDFSTFFPLDVYPTADISKYPVNRELALELAPKFYRSFLIHRIINAWRIIFKIRSLEDLRYMIQLVKAGIGMIKKSVYKTTTKGLLYDKN